MRVTTERSSRSAPWWPTTRPPSARSNSRTGSALLLPRSDLARLSRSEIGCEQLVDLRVRNEAGEVRKSAVRLQRPRRADETRPSSERECAPDTDAAYSECRDVGDVESDVAPDQEVERFWMHRLHERLDFFGFLGPWREEHVGAGLCVGLEAPNRLTECIGMPDVIALGSGSEHHAAAGTIDRLPCRFDAIDRK